MAKTILNITENYAVVRITGAGAETIDVDTDLLKSTQELDTVKPRKVGLSDVQWTCGESVIISRNGVNKLELYPGANNFALGGQTSAIDYTDGDKNITVTIAGGGTVYLVLRKAGGYLSKIEPEYFGQYDNPTKVGE
jgi:hypothetical protein